MSRDVVVSVEGLTLELQGLQPALVEDVSFDVASGETVALIGESGCGKTVTAQAVLGLLPPQVRAASGRIVFQGTPLTRELAARLRGREIGAVFQNPMTSLDPTMKVGDQIAESRRVHLNESRRVARRHAVELLELVGVTEPQKRARQFPHQFSGGMQQRAMIAAAIACEPKLLIADEPTTALDVTVQAEILILLDRLKIEVGMGMLLVTHDLGVVAAAAARVAVMYAGHVVEQGRTEEIFENPAHPYTQGLLASVPADAEPRSRLRVIGGRVPSAGDFPVGCRFQTRCPHAEAACARGLVPVQALETTHEVRCILHEKSGAVNTHA
ncbi:ABC transporter ATP-binding protein [Aeromicrobium phragmitis]|uniref:ABC transporter ATP-binding protein n=1 Tax=Aeromicrobium phragmitis TaxID=2478914 RepID=A0A3L8PPJ2_9ACTN|nr:ABC transporter ATP-binding protein [Aeromicrobium phragmitis]RLV57250.1 ABC transporter ATP-binding protein [Aeromicrobium phragmitis]